MVKISSMLGDLDQPVIIGKVGWFKGGTLRVLVINEDKSYREHFVRFPKSYVIKIINKSYLFVPKCVIRGKHPTIVYYFNNPFPIDYEFQISTLKAIDLYSEDQKALLDDDVKVYLAKVSVDADIITLGFDNRFMAGMYGQGGLSVKVWLIIMGVVVVLILLFLQLTGKIDIIGSLNSGLGGK